MQQEYRNKRIRNNIMYALLIVCVAALIVCGGVTTLVLMNVRDQISEGNKEISISVADNIEKSKISESASEVSSLVIAQSKTIETKLEPYKDILRLMKSYMNKTFSGDIDTSSVDIKNAAQVSEDGWQLYWYADEETMPEQTHTIKDLEDLGALEQTKKLAKALSLFDTLHTMFPSIKTMYMETGNGVIIEYDPDAKLIAALPSGRIPKLSERQWYNDTISAGEINITDTYQDFAGRGLTVTISIPVGNAEGIGNVVIGLDISAEYLDKYIQETTMIGNSYGVLINGKGDIISAPNIEKDGIKSIDYYLGSESSSIISDIAKDTSDVRETMLFNSDGKRVKACTAWAPITNTSWFLVYVVPFEYLASSAETIKSEVLDMSDRIDSTVVYGIRTVAIVWLILLLALICITIYAARVLSGMVAKPINEAIERAENANAAKEIFLANMSHEMRSPLNAVIGLSMLTLEADRVKGEDRENLKRIYGSGTTLLNIVNDILDISKIESGSFSLMPEVYQLPDAIAETADINAVRIGSKPIEFVIDITEGLPYELFGDALRIKQIFNNLLSNAFKNTDEGSVCWDIDYEETENGFWIVSSVTDTGVGITENDQKNLFKEYKQLGNDTVRRSEGTGLGLSITKALLELMEGSISLSSVYGEGSTFTVRFKQEKVNDKVIDEPTLTKIKEFNYKSGPFDAGSGRNMTPIKDARVLVVDDMNTNLVVARGMLTAYGIETDTLLSGSETVERIASGEPVYDAVFLDHMMPGMDGIETAKRIREIDSEYAKNVPLIALTANAVVGSEEMFLSNGFNGFISKPIDVRMLDEAVDRFVRKPKLRNDNIE